ncbi:HTTM domain-containing protein [Archangium violaceum]|uniref:HTTM domain-containing protein n=1 Tax=Archangium violaceum TaxID=83451 RepID=UPI0036D8F393
MSTSASPSAFPGIAAAWNELITRMSQPRFLIGASLFRILAGSAILIEYLINYAHRRYLFGPNGLWPYEVFAADMARSANFSLYSWSRSPVYFEVIFHLGIVVAALWLLGWRTRFLTPLNYVFLWSLHQRFPGIWDGGDNIIHLVLVYATFANVSAYFSMDASRRQARPEEPGPWAPVSAMFHNTAMLAIAMQISLVYGLAGLYKVQGPVWQEGTALYYAFRGGQFVWPGVTEWIYRDAFVVTALSYGTVAFQVAFPFLLFLNRYTRRVAVVLGFTFHLGIALFLGLITFSLFMTSVDLALMGDEEYRAIGNWLERLRQRFQTRQQSSTSLEAGVETGSSSGSPPPG